MNKQFERLFEPGRIGQMNIRNRIVMPAMQSDYAEADGSVGERIKNYYEARAKGGVGLIITEASPVIVSPANNAYFRPLLATEDRFIPGLHQLAQTIQKHGARAAYQLVHTGPADRLDPVGPSASGPSGGVWRELTEGEIAESVNAFARAAKRIREAGFDGIEIHAAHHYLIARFLSPVWNKRKDKYGGPLVNRARFLLEVVRAVTEAVGPDFPLWCRVNVEETGFPGGGTIKEGQEVSRMLAVAGVDALNASTTDTNLSSARPAIFPCGWGVRLAEAVKQVVALPVIAVGRITPEIAEQTLREGKADLIAMGRPLRTDPEFPNKVASGKFDEILPCIRCNVCLVCFRPDNGRLCAVNAAIGREQEYAITPARKKKHILVVGGGPAGMEAARVAAQRGHKVTLCEKNDRLGGQLLVAAAPPHKDIISQFTAFMVREVARAGVKVELNREVTPEVVKKLSPDVTIVATGVLPIIPKIAGIDGSNVVLSGDVLAGKAETGKTVAVIGGGQVGCETAEFLAGKGREVTIVEMLDGLLSEMAPRQGKQNFLDDLAVRGVTMLTGVKAEAITDETLVVVDKSGKKQVVRAETVVLAIGSKPNISLFKALEGKVGEIHLAGDCIKPRKILQAIDEASQIARQI